MDGNFQNSEIINLVSEKEAAHLGHLFWGKQLTASLSSLLISWSLQRIKRNVIEMVCAL